MEKAHAARDELRLFMAEVGGALRGALSPRGEQEKSGIMENEQNERNELDELARDIRKLITENRKFLDKVLDEDFEPEEDDSEDPPEVEL